MAALYRILLLLSVAVASVAAHKSQRTKRSLLELAEVIKCSTGRSALAYMMYGCYCGLGGQGLPKDRADCCCFKHDCCYGEAERLGCQPKGDPYHWRCKDHTVVCDEPEDTCKRKICKCDREFAKCLRQAPYDPTNCMKKSSCTGKPLPCEYKCQQ